MIKRIYQFFLQIFFPIECISCGKDNILLCSKCLTNIPSRLHQPKLSSGIQISVAYGYSIPLIKKAIIRSKYYHSPILFTDITLHSLPTFQSVFQNILPDEKNILLPVPLHYFRKQRRGFNQSEIISECISDNFSGWETLQFLKRTKNTPQQAKLKKTERLKNLTNAFSLNTEMIKEYNISKKSNIIIVDDVISTGATIIEIERVLKDAGFTNVSALGLCRGG